MAATDRCGEFLDIYPEDMVADCSGSLFIVPEPLKCKLDVLNVGACFGDLGRRDEPV